MHNTLETPETTKKATLIEMWQKIRKGNVDGSIATVDDVLDLLVNEIDED